MFSWKPGLGEGKKKKKAAFSTLWEASNTGLHQEYGCWMEWTLRLSQKSNSYFPVTSSFLLGLENEPKTLRSMSCFCCWLPASPGCPCVSIVVPICGCSTSDGQTSLFGHNPLCRDTSTSLILLGHPHPSLGQFILTSLHLKAEFWGKTAAPSCGSWAMWSVFNVWFWRISILVIQNFGYSNFGYIGFPNKLMNH